MAHIKPGTFAMTALLALLTSIGPLSTDMYLPSLPSIQRHFGGSAGQAQWTLSVYLFGFAIAQVFYGPLADRKGRKSVMLVGLLIYGLGNLASAFAPSLDVLILSRLVQGFGAAGPLVIARAIVRDLYEGHEAGQQLARMGTIMGLVPAVAPLIGAGLELTFGWRANFLGIVILVIVLASVVLLRLPETLRVPLTTPFSVREMLRGYDSLIRDRRFLPFALMNTATYAGLFAFISGSSFVIQGHFGLNPGLFALAFGLMVLGFISGTVLAQRVVSRAGSLRAIEVGAFLQAGGGLAMLAFTFLTPYAVLGLAGPQAIYAMGVGFSMPQSAAGAMMPFPERAGSVSSLLGIVQMSFAALVGACVGAAVPFGPIALTSATAIMGVCAVLLLPAVRRASPFASV
ncbi:ProP Permeases of the major facilitator superfamily [Rhabdaerophilaceae bacterium]